MAERPYIANIGSLQNESSAIATINENFNELADAFEGVLSRSENSENILNVPLDMNGQRILNLPAPTRDHDPIRRIDFSDALLTRFTVETLVDALRGYIGDVTLQISRSAIPSRVIPLTTFKAIGYYTDYDLGYGAVYRRGQAGNATDIQDAAGTWFTLQVTDQCSVGWTGARGDGSDATAAFVTARLLSPALYVPRGLYGVHNFDLGDNAILRGVNNQVSVLYALVDCDHIVRIGAASSAFDIKCNGNLHASKCVSMRGPFVRCERVYVQYPKFISGTTTFRGAGFFNEKTSTRFYLIDTGSDNCRAAILGGAGINNCFIIGHDSRGADYYGLFAKSDDASDAGVVQGLFIKECSFIGNTYGLWFDSLAFAITISSTTLDHIFGSAIVFNAEDNSAIEIGPGNFVTAHAGYNVVDIGAGTSNLIIHGNQGISNGMNCVVVRATPTKRCRGVHIDNNNLGPGDENVLLLDSPGNDWTVAKNLFSPRPPAGLQVAALQTFSDASELGFINVDYNCFKTSTKVVGEGAFRIRARYNEGLADIVV